MKINSMTSLLKKAAVIAGMTTLSMLAAFLHVYAENIADTSWYSDADTEFTLHDAADLAGFSELVNAGNDFKGKTVKLDADINLSDSDEEWTPIGNNEDTPFSGTFDGQGHTVSGINISAQSMGGLFGRLTRAKIRDTVVSGN